MVTKKELFKLFEKKKELDDMVRAGVNDNGFKLTKTEKIEKVEDAKIITNKLLSHFAELYKVGKMSKDVYEDTEKKMKGWLVKAEKFQSSQAN